MAIILVYGDFEIPAGGKTENFFFIQTPEGRVPWSKKIAPAIDRIVQATVPEPHNKPYQRPKTITGKRVIDGVEKEYSVIRSWPRERKRRAHWSIEGDTEGAYLKLWNIGNHNNYVWNGTDFEKVKGREENPDWSRESMKTILAWGWVSPTGQDHIGQRKDKTHDAMAYELGLGTWVQAVKAGWVRYILFSDNHLGLTLIITPATLTSARKLVNRPDVFTVSFEWLVDGKIEQSGSLPGKSALAAIRAKGRVGNPYYLSDAVVSWGFLTPTGKEVLEPEGSNEDMTHETLASDVLGMDVLELLEADYTRFLVEKHGDDYVLNYTFLKTRTRPAKAIISHLRALPIDGEVNVEVVDSYYDTTIYGGQAKSKAKAIAWLKEWKAKREREQNPPYHGGGIHTGNVFSWGFISPTGMVMDGANDDSAPRGGGTTHDKLARAYGLGGEGKALAKGYVRYLSGMMKSGRVEVSATIAEPWAGPAKALRKYIDVGLHGPVAHILDLDFVERSGYTHYASIAVVGEEKIKAVLSAVGRGEDPADVWERMRVESRGGEERNPLTLTPTHRSQAVSNKFHTLVEMTPMEFLRLTTVDDRQIKEIMETAKPLATYNDAATAGRNIIPCFLTLDIASGQAKVMGHEGRHRAAALFMNGEEGVGLPVYLRVTDAHPGQAKKMLAGLPGGEKQWMWDTTYLWGWDEIPEMFIGQFKSTVKVPKSRFRVVEPYVQERGKKARGL